MLMYKRGDRLGSKKSVSQTPCVTIEPATRRRGGCSRVQLGGKFGRLLFAFRRKCLMRAERVARHSSRGRVLYEDQIASLIAGFAEDNTGLGRPLYRDSVKLGFIT